MPKKVVLICRIDSQFMLVLASVHNYLENGMRRKKVSNQIGFAVQKT